MFTGIILAIGKVAVIQPQEGDFRLKIETGKLSMEQANLGDSISVSGICLTAVELGDNFFYADVSNETIFRTTLKSISVGSGVNLELALLPTTRLGGHIVSGHVDGLGLVVSKDKDGRSFRYTFQAPDDLAKYIAEKGSICIDGVSLTVNKVNGVQFCVNIVPHTLLETTLSELSVGTKVNLEVDLLARYMERLMKGEAAIKNSSGVTEGMLKNTGFLKCI
ncbi:MAG: riboflavin synthase, partial [Methylococcaceae bacterium]|nr:riboflavin synthase [Methylococcaceae bacterium]